MTERVVIVGAGGHGRVVADALRAAGRILLGMVDPDPSLLDSEVDGVPVLGPDEALTGLVREGIQLANGLGSVGSMKTRRVVFERLKADGWTFATIVHPSAWVSPTASIGEGAQVMAGAIVQTGAHVGLNAIVNTRASIDHDCQIGDHAHLAPGVTLSGAVVIGEATHVGTGATMIQGVSIGPGSLVAAGAVVTRSFPAESRLFGIPARQR